MIGDQVDVQTRLSRLIPNGWFGDSPIQSAVLAGLANPLSFIYALIEYRKAQTRIATATDANLDLIAYDFFGFNVVRAPGQSDDSFRNTIKYALFRLRNTREAIILAVESLLGTFPTVIEPQRAEDTFCWDTPTSAWDVAGLLGDRKMPIQCFVEVIIPASLAIAPANSGGYDVAASGYDTGTAQWVGPPSINPITLSEIYASIASVLPVCGVAWVSVSVGGSGTSAPSITVDTTLVTVDSALIADDGGSVG